MIFGHVEGFGRFLFCTSSQDHVKSKEMNKKFDLSQTAFSHGTITCWRQTTEKRETCRLKVIKQ